MDGGPHATQHIGLIFFGILQNLPDPRLLFALLTSSHMFRHTLVTSVHQTTLL
jgi:hypothetical protein